MLGVSNNDFLLKNYARTSPRIVRGEASYLFDEDDRRYLDFISGIGVCCLGHAHPELSRVIQRQSSQLLHCSNMYHIPGQEILAQKLCQKTGLAAAFFCNSGTEANEALFKFARLYQEKHNRAYAYRVLSLTHSFHGRTLASLAATGSPHFHRKFQPLPQGFDNLPADISVFRQLLDDTCAAVIVEVVQGDGGLITIEADFLQELQELCRKREVLFMIDEIQSGVGRTGRFFSYEHHALKPDMVSLAKGLGGGIAIGAVLVNEEVAAVIEPGDHGSTFGGNPLAVAAANYVVDTVGETSFLEQVVQSRLLLEKQLKPTLQRYSLKLGGIGLMIGLHGPDAQRLKHLQQRCLDMGLLTSIVSSVALRMLPPLNIEEEQLVEGCEILSKAVHEVLS